MTRDEIIKLAREAGMYVTTRQSTFDAMLERFWSPHTSARLAPTS